MFEKDLPGQHTTGFNPGQPVTALPLETAETINNSWGFNLADQNFKSAEALVGYLVRAAGHNANFLLNVGPRPDGTIPEPEVELLRAMGDWLERFGTSIYGTRGGPTEPATWGVTTQRNDTVFVHVLDHDQPLLALPPLPHRITSASLLDGGRTIPFSQSAEGVVLTLPAATVTTIDRVVVLAPAR